MFFLFHSLDWSGWVWLKFFEICVFERQVSCLSRHNVLVHKIIVHAVICSYTKLIFVNNVHKCSVQ